MSTTTTFAETKRPELKIIQPEKTLTGGSITPPARGLPKTVQTLCPECCKVIPGLQFEEDGKVMMEKTCPEHGQFTDCIFSDARLYLKMEEWEFGDMPGIANPINNQGAASKCPDDCGMCSLHTSHAALANVDLTNRCNMTCPVCFANANAAGYLYEPSFEQIRGMLQTLRDMRPVDSRVVQFSGGEPTIHPQFVEILALAKEMGFTHIQAATNGLLFADSLEFTQRCKDAGLSTIYLQFDGVTDDIYLRTRGEPLLEKKMQVIENCRQARHQDRLRAHHRQGHQRPSARRHPARGHQQRGHGQRHQLPAGGLHRPHLAQGAGGRSASPWPTWRTRSPSRPASSTRTTTGSRSPASRRSAS